MKDEIRVNDYVRTDRGYITKISDFKEHYTKGKRLGLKEEVVENFLLLDDKQCEIIDSIDYSIPPCYPSDEELEKIKSHIIKSSPNIIDLIEYDDVLKIMYEEKEYVCKVVNVSGVKGLQLTSTLSVGLGVVGAYIKSIVTREQFESMEYKVGE